MLYSCKCKLKINMTEIGGSLTFAVVIMTIDFLHLFSYGLNIEKCDWLTNIYIKSSDSPVRNQNYKKGYLRFFSIPVQMSCLNAIVIL